MSNRKGPAHVVVDGSNIATEGRSMPSLAQLSEAVSSFMDEYPDAAITVVVDATFGHRIDKKEVSEFEAGISNNELVAPPAGAVGRGDAFVLGIADKVGASILSNDSFQEFHGDYKWLFDDGRLIGGKPVPHIGWVWVDRVPVRGPISRKATRGSGGAAGGGRRGSSRRRRSGQDDESTVRTGSREASAPMPKPKSPPPGRASTAASANRSEPVAVPKKAPRRGDPVNDMMPFLDFVESHPVGTSVNGTVDAYSSHGAYITIADAGVRGYVPLRLMGDPMPRSAKSVMKQGESVTVVVVSFAPARRSIDCALPDMARDAIAEAATEEREEQAAASTAAGEGTADEKSAARETVAKGAAKKKAAAKKQSASVGSADADTTTADTTSGDEPSTKKATSRRATTKKAAGKKAVTKKSPATKAVAKKKAAAKKKATSKKTASKKAPSKKTASKKAASKKTAAKKKTTAEKAATKTTGANSADDGGAAGNGAEEESAATPKAAAKKTTARKKAPARKKAAAKKSASE